MYQVKKKTVFFFLQIFPLGTIFPSLGTSDPAVFTNVSPGTSQSNSITERLGKIYRDIRRNMMIRYNVKNVMRKTEYHVCFFQMPPHGTIQSNQTWNPASLKQSLFNCI